MRDIVQQNFLKNQNIIRLKKDFFKRIEGVRYMRWFQYKNLKSWKETQEVSRLVTNTALIQQMEKLKIKYQVLANYLLVLLSL